MTENKELEQEIHNEAMKLRTSPCYEELEAFARHFVEWGKNHHGPVSEDLEAEWKEYFKYRGDIATVNIKDLAKHFANWQKEQFEKNRLKHCNSITNEQAELEQGFIDQHIDKYQRMPTFLDAIEYGMQMMKEQMMKEAVDGNIRRNKYTKKNVLNGLDVVCEAVQKFKDGDKLKIIFVKEEWL